MPQLPHVGFVIAKKVDKRATRRNQAKRRVREAYRQTRMYDHSITQWYAMVFVIHEKALTATWQEIKETVSQCISRAGTKFGKPAPKKQNPAEDPLSRQGL
jgi:ribonuclease P protein component